MSKEIVGSENLPNVYIKEISLDSNSNTDLSVEVVLYLKDYKDGRSKFQWYENETLRKNMKIVVVHSTIPTFNNNVREGLGSISPNHLKYITGYNKKGVGYKIIPLQILSKENLVEDTEGAGLYTFGYRCKFKIPSTNNLSIFAACVLDIKQFAVEEDLDLLHKSVSSYHGPVVGEVVLTKGKVPTETKLMRKGGVIYTGPAHRHGGQWMAGSKQSGTRSEPLVVHSLGNRKVKDYRIPYNKKISLNKTGLSKIPVFGKLNFTFNEAGNLNAVFDVNMKQLFIQNTLYGKLLFQLDKDLFNQIISKIRITEFSIFRENVVTKRITSRTGVPKEVVRRSFNKATIITTQDAKAYKLKPKRKYFNSITGRSKVIIKTGKTEHKGEESLRSSVRELKIHDSIDIRTFSFSDLEFSKTSKGDYKYSVLLKFQDPTQEFLKVMIDKLSKGLSMFRLYKQKVERRINYDYTLGQTKRIFYTKMEQGTLQESWTKFLVVYLEFYDLLFKTSNNEISSLSEQLLSLISPRTATVKSLNRFYFHYQFMYNYVIKFFNYKRPGLSESITRGNVNVEPNKGKISVGKKFDEIIRFNTSLTAISFLPREISSLAKSALDSFPLVHRGYFHKLSKREIDKFYFSKPKFTKESVPFLDRQSLSFLNDIENYSYTYLSPNSISSGEKTFDLSKVEKVDLFSFNLFYNEFVSHGFKAKSLTKDVKERRKKEILNKVRSSFFIKKKSKKANRAHKEKGENLSINEAMGPSSEFVNSKKKPTTIGNNVLKPKLKNVFHAFESRKETKTKMNSKDFILDQQSSLLSSFVNSRKFSPIDFSKIPLQLKAVMGSKKGFAKTKILNSNMDLLANPLTKDFINLAFFTIAKIEFQSGFKKSQHGEELLTQPIWKELTQENYNKLSRTTLCRMTFFADPRLKIGENRPNSFRIENQFFYLNGSGKNRLEGVRPGEKATKFFIERTIKNFKTEMESDFKAPIEYTRTIVIKQPILKDGPLSFVDYKESTDMRPIPDSAKEGY